MRLLIATTQTPFVRGGAEILAEGLESALRRAGHEAEIVRIPFKWYPAEAIPPQVLAARLLDLSEFSGVPVDRVIGLKFPAYLIPHPDRMLWLVHQHRAAYDFWESGFSDLMQMPGGRSVRDFIREADRLHIPEARRVYTISRNVSARLERHSGIASEALYHPPANADAYGAGEFRDYFLFPSRIDAVKRQWLAIDALAEANLPMKVVFVGAPDNPAIMSDLVARAGKRGVTDRIRWAGALSEAEKIDLYANATAILYPPLDEDYGYVTLEGMLAHKPVITCSDSGGPLEFIRHGVSGLVAGPDAQSLARAMETLWDDRASAKAMGTAARQAYADMRIGWDAVVTALTARTPAEAPRESVDLR
ncbi:MAG TPA: glycosyltransferase family 4 protein [Casimicrobiaceae bacterium]|nr:glycosyltransferase family 4 protein [Casimicrobiaceae bacterium]